MSCNGPFDQRQDAFLQKVSPQRAAVRVVMIHGRSQQGKDPRRLELEWQAALGRGFIAAGMRPLAAEQMRFCFYGELFERYARRVQAETQSATALQRHFAREMTAKLERRGIAPRPGGETMTVAFYDGALTLLERIPGFAPGVLRRWVRDVHDYLENVDGLRHRTMQRLAAMLESLQADRPLVLIAHSLGTIIAYDVLATWPDLSVDLLVTLGAPLGINNAVRNRLLTYREGADNIPAGVKRWLNLADPDDVVALDDRLNDDFAPPGTAFIRDLSVDNGRGRSHASDAYLSQPALAREIAVLVRGGGE